MSSNPEQHRHLQSVPDSQELAREQAAAARSEIERLTRMTELIQLRDQHLDTIAARQEQVAKIDAELRALHGKPGSTVKAGDRSVTWKNPSRSFNSAQFCTDYSPATHPHLYETKTVLDTSAIPPKLKEKYMMPGSGEGTLTIK